jgi:hypothetical protein
MQLYSPSAWSMEERLCANGVLLGNLAGEFVKRNAGHVEIFAGAKQLLNGIADFQCCHAGHTPRPATPAEHGADVFHIGIKSTALKVQRCSASAHRRAAIRAGLPAYLFRFFRTWPFVHWSRCGMYVVTMSTDCPAQKSTTTCTGIASLLRA